MKFTRLSMFLFALSAMFFNTVSAQTDGALSDIFADEPEFLQVDEAFRFDFSQDGDQLSLSWQIAEGYYLYKKQFKTVVKNAEISEPSYPKSEQIEDEFFGLSDVFRGELILKYPVIQSVQDGVVKVRYQGCADAGLCYPPTTKVVYLNQVGSEAAQIKSDASSNTKDSSKAVSEQFELADLLSGDNNLAWTLLLFVALGIGLSFTPCVFPMYPILSGIIIGQGKAITTSKALTLSFFYVQGMAITYSLLGLIVASAGVQFQASLQHPAILITLIVIFVLLAIVMFGAYELQMPSSWQEKLNAMSNQQKSGNYIGVMVMGAISGLVASPCTTAPLTGILLYIAQSGDLVLGFTALYALSIGMGIPLILFAITGGKLLPKAGNWMNIVKVTFGFMMLAVALMFVERMLTNPLTDIAWTLLGLATFTYFYVMNAGSATSLAKGIRAFVIFVGLFASAIYGYQSMAQFGLNTSTSTTSNDQHQTAQHPDFIVVKSLDDFAQKLAVANGQGKSVMVDLYADWCVACKEFEKYTFPDQEVIKALSNTVWMQIDLTDNTAVNLQFQEEFSILGLPTILFFGQEGKEIPSSRVTGFMRAPAFAKHVSSVLK